MRAFLILLCAAIAAWCGVTYARSAEAVGFNLAGYGVSYAHPSPLALGGAILFGILAIALAIEGFTVAKRNTPPAPQPQIIVVPQWQSPPQASPPSEAGKQG